MPITIKRLPGRPKAVIKFPHNCGFTVKTLCAYNPKVCSLTIRKELKSKIKDGVIVRLPEDIRKSTSGTGRPCHQYKMIAELKEKLDVEPTPNF